jgi:hypothetical protein
VVAVVENDMIPYMEDSWKNQKRNLSNLESFMKCPAPKETNPLQADTFLEFIEKQVIMDVLFEPFLYKNFI